MGVIPQPPPYRDDPDAVSMHTTPDDYTYDDAPEIFGLPPSYTDSESGSSAATMIPPLHHIRHIPPPTTRSHHSNPTMRNGKPQVCETITYMDSQLDNNPDWLESAIRRYANVAPVPLIYIMGTHRETVKKGNKKETQDVTDFRVVVNMQRYLRKNFDDQDTTSMDLVTVENIEKTYRGSIMKCRAPAMKQDIEVRPPKPNLIEWCHRYCASPRMLRIFRLRRTVTGFDKTFMRHRLEGLVRATNYRGQISVTFPVEDQNVDIYTSNKINKWRLTTWIQWLFYLTFLWIFTWPYLFFMTKRYAVVQAEWPFSMLSRDGHRVYTTVSEDQWLEKWQIAIRRMVLDQYQGEASEDMMSGFIARPEDPPMPGSGPISTGHAGIDNAVGILTQGFQIARAVQNGGNLGRGVQGGWGHNT